MLANIDVNLTVFWYLFYVLIGCYEHISEIRKQTRTLKVLPHINFTDIYIFNDDIPENKCLRKTEV